MPGTISAKEAEQNYLATFAVRRSELGGSRELKGIRDAAIARFGLLGFPTTHNEEWKYTNLAPFLRTGFEPSRSLRTRGVAARLAAAPFADLGCPRLVFLNGRYAAGLSVLSDVDGAVKIGSLRAALMSGAVDGHLGREAAFENNAMVALNTAFLEDGALVEIASGAVVSHPIHLVFVSAGGRPAVAYPRSLVVAGRESQAEIVETYVGLDDGIYFTNAVTEIVAGDGSVLSHYKIQAENEAALHFGMLAVRQGGSSNFVSHNVALGAALARNEISVVLDGEGADCTLNGLYVTTGNQHVDNHTTLDHAKPHCTSHELYKGVLDGRSQGVFHGRIIVRAESQKTDAIQRNKNLLLSDTAVINTKPQLEIYADDVKCTHGATVGQVDQDAVFYLRSRGIGLKEARSLLTFAFTADVLNNIKIEAIRSGLSDTLFRRLAGAGNESV
jgi:Fe-S cluster assembly protein SufD